MAKIDDLGNDLAVGDLGGGLHIDDLGGGLNLGDLGEPAVIPIVYSANMRGLITRRVYSEDVVVTGSSDELVETYLETLTVNPEVARYDWSAMSVATYGTTVGDPDPEHSDDWTNSVPCTLISDTFAIAGDHNIPRSAISAKCWFLTPAGAAVSAAVESETTLTNSQATLIKFATNPSVDLARFPICTNESLLAYDGRDSWLFFQTQAIKLRKLDGFVTDYNNTYAVIDAINLIEGAWVGDNINAGSGRPVVVPCRNGSLVMIGILAARDSSTQNKANQISLDLDQITTVLATEGETFETVELRYGSDELQMDHHQLLALVASY